MSGRKDNKWQRVLRLLVAFAIGVAFAFYAYQWASDPQPAIQRAREEAVVLQARSVLLQFVEASDNLQIVDPLAPDRKIGKVFIYPTDDGWEVSGYYRRDANDPWHPWLMRLDGNAGLSSLTVKDGNADLMRRAAGDARLTIKP